MLVRAKGVDVERAVSSSIGDQLEHALLLLVSVLMMPTAVDIAGGVNSHVMGICECSHLRGIDYSGEVGAVA